MHGKFPDFGTKSNRNELMREVLRLGRSRVIEFLEEIGNRRRHGEVNKAIFIVPIKVISAEVFAFPINNVLVMLR